MQDARTMDKDTNSEFWEWLKSGNKMPLKVQDNFGDFKLYVRAPIDDNADVIICGSKGTFDDQTSCVGIVETSMHKFLPMDRFRSSEADANEWDTGYADKTDLEGHVAKIAAKYAAAWVNDLDLDIDIPTELSERQTHWLYEQYVQTGVVHADIQLEKIALTNTLWSDTVAMLRDPEGAAQQEAEAWLNLNCDYFDIIRRDFLLNKRKDNLVAKAYFENMSSEERAPLEMRRKMYIALEKCKGKNVKLLIKDQQGMIVTAAGKRTYVMQLLSTDYIGQAFYLTGIKDKFVEAENIVRITYGGKTLYENLEIMG